MTEISTRPPTIFSDDNCQISGYFGNTKIISKVDGKIVGLVDGDIVAHYFGFLVSCDNKLIDISRGKKTIVFPEKVAEKFSDLVDVFSRQFRNLERCGVTATIKLHNSDKTWKDCTDALGKNNIGSIYLINTDVHINLVDNPTPIIIESQTPNKSEFLKAAYQLLMEPRTSAIVTYRLLTSDRLDCTPENCFFIQEEAQILTKKTTITLDECAFQLNAPNILSIVTGPFSVIEKETSNLFHDKFCGTKIIAKSGCGKIIASGNNLENYYSVECHLNMFAAKLRWRAIIDVCIALSGFSVPKYVLLEIVDWLPFARYENHRRKIDLIFAVYKSIAKIKNKEADCCD